MHARQLFRGLLALPAALLVLVPAARAAPSPGVWTVTGSMHQARALQTATLLPSGLVLVAGGENSAGPLASAELYHAHTGSWASTGAMHQPRAEFTATLLRDGRVLAAGGCSTASCPTILASAEIYDPRTGRWTRTGAMHEPRIYHTATLLPDGRVLVAGGVARVCSGTTCLGVLSTAELYDPRTGTWTRTGSMRQGRARQTATLLPDGLVLVAGGAGSGAHDADAAALASAELYDPHTGTWTRTGSLHDARWSGTEVLLAGGVVLVAGGYGDSGPVLRAEIYQPHAGAWAVTGSLHYPRAYETGESAALLPGGRVLVAGSYEGAVAPSDNPGITAEIYRPGSGTWALAASMHEPHIAQTSTALPNGQVLVAGGCPARTCSTALAGAELYRP